MLEQPVYALGPTASVRDLVWANPWATMVSANGDDAPVVSHLPVLLDPDDPDDAHATVLTHLPTQDAKLHHLGDREVVIIVEGPNGYVTPSWYDAEPYVPTWNYTVAHLHGRPEPLDEAGTYRVLELTVERFENERPQPWRLDSVEEYAHSIAPYAVGLRLRPTRVVGKAKLSQDKPNPVIEKVIDALRKDQTHANPELAAQMAQWNSARLGGRA